MRINGVDGFPPVQVNDTRLDVRIITTNNRNAYARVKNGSIEISIPSFVKADSARKIANELYNKIKRGITRKPELYLFGNHDMEIGYHDNDTINVMGRSLIFKISTESRKNAGGSIFGNEIRISVPDSLSDTEKSGAISRITRVLIIKSFREEIERRIMMINQQYFGSRIEKIRIINASSRWGSCTTSRRLRGARISINYKLLFMPIECVDYVIVHELAHTKLHNHSKEFWGIVEGVMPDYKEQRRRLRQGAFELKAGIPTHNPNQLLGGFQNI